MPALHAGGLRPDSALGDPGRAQATSERNLVRSHNLATFTWFPTCTPRDPSCSVPSTSPRRCETPRRRKPNVAGLGRALYSDHLLTVELAGALLFVALIAAVVIHEPEAADSPGRAGRALRRDNGDVVNDVVLTITATQPDMNSEQVMEWILMNWVRMSNFLKSGM